MVNPPAAAPAPASAPPPALGEFDPFASESVKAIVGPPSAAPAGAAAAPAPIQQTTAMPPPAFPETGAIEAVTPPVAMGLATIVGVLTDVDYFQVLRIPYEAKVPEIKKAFYRESRTYHPDRFFHLQDEDVKTDISTVYKRITEAYYFLKDDAKRKKYLMDIASPERKAKLRFNEVSEVETKQLQKKEQEEQIGTHPKGRQLYATALKDIEAKRFGDAQRNLKSALMYERENARYKEKLAEVEQRLAQEFKDKGQQFKIR